MASRKRGRSAVTGRFVDRLQVARHPDTTIVESVPPPTVTVGIVATATAHVIRANPEEG